MKFKRVITASLALVMAMQMTGCGGKKTASDDKVTLKLWTKPTQDATENDVAIHEEWITALKNKFPNVTFEESIAPAGSDYRTEYDKALMAGTAPAYNSMFSYTDIPSRIKNKTIADITEYVADWDLRKEGKVLDTFDEAICSDGKWYAMPKYAYTMACFVNRRLLRENGESDSVFPETWDEFAKQGAKITDFSVPRIGYALVGMDWCAWPFTAWVWSAGGEMVRQNDDGTYKLAFNEDAGVDAAVFMNEMIWKHKMTQKDVLMSMKDLESLAQNQTAVYSWNQLSIISKEAIEKYNLDPDDYTVMAMPVKDKSIDRPALAGGEVIAFNPKLSEEELAVAVDVVKYSDFSDERMKVSIDNIKKYGSTSVTVPGRVDYYEKKLDAIESLTEQKRNNLIELSKNAKPEPFCEHWSELKTELVNPLQEIFLKEGITRDEVKKLLDDCADKLYSMYPDTFKK